MHLRIDNHEEKHPQNGSKAKKSLRDWQKEKHSITELQKKDKTQPSRKEINHCLAQDKDSNES